MQEFTITNFQAIVLLIIGIFIRLRISKRRFYRRSMTGRPWFSSYAKSVYLPIVEGLLMIIATIMILGGTMALIYNYLNW